MRRSIQSIGTPLAFKVQDVPALAMDFATDRPGLRFRTFARALEGMQKEAIVLAGPQRTAWRLVCDEGPYLNGTDLAPFPLAFYTAGLVSAYAAALEQVAEACDLQITSMRLIQDSRYTMEGSALKGTMRGGALPVDLEVALESTASEERVREVIHAAVLACPGDACARTPVASTFAARLNREHIDVPGVSRSPGALPDPSGVFEEAQPMPQADYAPDIIAKIDSAEAVFGVEGGAGSSLKEEQKRTLHVRGVLSSRADGLKAVTIQLFSPRGSGFRIVSQSAYGGPLRAPCCLSLLSAGIAFCYLTQIGRYAHIVKQRLDDYRIVQDTTFHVPVAPEERTALVAPVDTHVFISSPEPAAAVARSIAMGEQTCFLHANLRGAHEAQVSIRLNGKRIGE